MGNDDNRKEHLKYHPSNTLYYFVSEFLKKVLKYIVINVTQTGNEERCSYLQNYVVCYIRDII